MATIFVRPSGDDSTGNGTEGNPYRTPGRGAADVGNNDILAIQTGTYVQTSTSSNVAGGICSPSATGHQIIGYETTVGDNGTKPILVAQATNTSGCLVLNGLGGPSVRNIRFQLDAGSTSSRLVIPSSEFGVIDNCDFEYVSSGSTGEAVSPISGSRNGFVRNCKFAGAFSTAISNAGSSHGNFIDGATVGISISGASGGINGNILTRCGQGVRVANNAIMAIVSGNIAYDCTGDGFGMTSNSERYGAHFIHNGAVNCGGYGFNRSGSNPTYLDLVGNFTFGNTSGRATGFRSDIDPIILTANPFIDADNDNFNLNDTADGGAVLRAILAAMPGVDTDIYPFGTWAAPVGGTSGLSRIRQGNLIGRSF